MKSSIPSLVRRQLCLILTSLLLVGFAGCREGVEEVEVSSPRVDADRLALESFNLERVNSFSAEEYEDVEGDRVSDRFPDINLIDHRGRSLQFYSDLVEDRCVCLIYFYTRCVGSCPVTTQVVKKLRKDLAEEFSNDEFLFVSLTLEPEVDSPEELQTYMKIHEIEDDKNLPDWIYATGDFEELDRLRKTLGIYDLDPIIDADKTEHAAILTFGNDRLNRWAALPVDMNYDQLKQAMIRIMGSSPRQRYASAAQYREDRLEEFRLAKERLLQQP